MGAAGLEKIEVDEVELVLLLPVGGSNDRIKFSF